MSVTTNYLISGVPSGSGSNSSNQFYVVPSPTGGDDSSLFVTAFSQPVDTIQIPADSTYLIGTAVSVPTGYRIVGVNRTTSVLKQQNSANLASMFYPANNAQDVVFENLTLDINQANNTSGLCRAIDLGVTTGVNFTKILNCNIVNSRGSTGAIHIYNNSDVEIAGCSFQNSYQVDIRLTYPFSRVNIRDNSFTNWARGGAQLPSIQIIHTPGSTPGRTDSQFCRNYFRSDTNPGTFSIEAPEPTGTGAGYTYDGNVVTDNIFDGNNIIGSGISCFFSNSVISSNVFINGATALTGGWTGWRNGIELWGENNAVSGNTIENGGMLVAKTSPYTARVGNVISGNTITITQSVAVTNIVGILMENQQGGTVSGNTIEINVSGSATVLAALLIGQNGGVMTNVDISNNVLTNTGLSGNGIRIVNGTSSGLKFNSNTIDGFNFSIQFPSNSTAHPDCHFTNNKLLNSNTPVLNQLRSAGFIFAGNTTGTASLSTATGIGNAVWKSTTYTASLLDRYVIGTTGSAWTLTLPVWPYSGQQIDVINSTTPIVNTLTIAYNGNTIDGALANASLAAAGTSRMNLTNLQKVQTATVTIATPGVVSATAHGLIQDQAFVWATTGALPTGITAGTLYYVIATGLTANAFQFSTSVGGPAVNTSGSQSGTHTIISNNWWTVR